MNTNIDVNDLITLDDGIEYIVISKANYENKEYYYIADLNNPSNLKFGCIDNSELVEITDGELIKILVIIFQKMINQ